MEETIDFPAQQGVIDALLEKAGVDSVHQRVFYMESYESGIDGLIEAVDSIDVGIHPGCMGEQFAKRTTSPNELNALAARVQRLDAQGRENFSDALMNTTNIVSMDCLQRLAERCNSAVVMEVYVDNAEKPELGGFSVPLPATKEYLKPFLDGIEITDPGDLAVESARSRLIDLEGVACFRAREGLNLDELNYLAVKIQALDEVGREILSAAFEAERHTGSVAEIINITENIRDFELHPAFSAEMLGEHLLNYDAGNYSKGIQALYNSKDETLREALNYIEVLEKYFNAAAYGKEYSENENGAFTEFGYLVEVQPFREAYRDRSDIPAEYRVLPNELPPLLKAADVDLLTFLVKAQAVTDKLTHSIDHALRNIAGGFSMDYLLVVSGHQLYVTETLSAYKRGDWAQAQLQSELGNAKARAFHLRVTSRTGSKTSGGAVIGGVIELRRDSLLADIKSHGIMPDRVDVVGANGALKSYDLLEWADTSSTYRSEAQSITRHYADTDLKAATGAFKTLSNSNARKAAAVDETALLGELSAAFMQTEYPQPDMLRIANEPARDILARGDADIYALTESGALKLPPIEAAKTGRFAEREDLAIKREDGLGLDKYAHRTATKLLREVERGDRAKSKDKGDEPL
ncbi:hypothetical protein FACS189490_04160 [Clostridia bacterium]|nr:hypothetical protein FACS189490_04160 [Clostridia bacterium]